MVDGGAHKLREQQVRTSFDGEAHRFLDARPRVEHEETVRRGPHDSVQCRRRFLLPPRQ